VAKHSFRKWYENLDDYKQMGNFLTKLYNSKSATWSKDYKYFITQNKLLVEVMIKQYRTSEM
jgi:hypothetical protein